MAGIFLMQKHRPCKVNSRPAVNWRKACRRQRRKQAGFAQEETGSNAKRPKRAGRPLFLTG